MSAVPPTPAAPAAVFQGAAPFSPFFSSLAHLRQRLNATAQQFVDDLCIFASQQAFELHRSSPEFLTLKQEVAAHGQSLVCINTQLPQDLGNHDQRIGVLEKRSRDQDEFPQDKRRKTNPDCKPCLLMLQG